MLEQGFGRDVPGTGCCGLLGQLGNSVLDDLLGQQYAEEATITA